MGFWDWLKGLFGPKTIKRDVTRLGGDADEVDDVEEVVDLSGGPYREHHQRRALRDRRLLPKKKDRRKKIIPGNEAKRLFAGTLRTRNRKLRDLLPDVDQLERYGLPVWKTEEDLAAALGVSVPVLRHFSIHRERERVEHYVRF